MQTLQDCETQFPVIIQASPSILQALESSNPETYIPSPADDLYALVCSLCEIVTEPNPCFFKTDGKYDNSKIRQFWETCGGQKGWRKALDAALLCNYQLVKEILGEVFAFRGQWDVMLKS